MFTTITIVTLALGIGANAAIFSVLEGVLLKPLPYPDPDRLIAVDHAAPGVNIQSAGIAPFLYFTYRDENRTLKNFGMKLYDATTEEGDDPYLPQTYSPEPFGWYGVPGNPNEKIMDMPIGDLNGNVKWINVMNYF